MPWSARPWSSNETDKLDNYEKAGKEQLKDKELSGMRAIERKGLLIEEETLHLENRQEC